jgi:hypothetical protein
MYRMFKTLPWFATACILAATLACNSSPSAPSRPDGAGVAVSEAGPNGETLKVRAPTLVSPTGSNRLENRRPTMTVQNVTGKYAGATFSYEFQLLSDGGTVIQSISLAQGAGTTSWAYPEDLERDTPYRWQARARLGNAVGPWSARERFLTLLEKRADDPPPGQRLPLPNHFFIIQQVAAQFPNALRNSCQEGGGTWEFMDRVVDALRLEDTRWGYNWKRAHVGDPSLDVVNYHFGPGPDEGSRDVWSVDILGGHCGPSPTPMFSNITNFGGSGAMWTSRGRF